MIESLIHYLFRHAMWLDICLYQSEANFLLIDVFAYCAYSNQSLGIELFRNCWLKIWINSFLSEVKDIAQFCRRFVSAVNLIMTALPLSSSATVYFASLQNISVPWYFHLKQTTQHWQDIFTSTFRNWGRFLAISRHWPFPDCPKLRLIKLVELPKSFTEFLTKAWSEL